MLEKPFLLLVLAAFNNSIHYISTSKCRRPTSPFFTRHNIKDDAFDWIDMSNRTKTLRGEPATDIVANKLF